MFCSKCGKELKDGVQFCPNCGTFNAAKANPAPDSSAKLNSESGITSSGVVLDVKKKIDSGLSCLGGRRILFIVNFVLYFLSMIFCMLPLSSIRAYGYTQSYSVFDAPEIGVPMLLLFIAGMVIMWLPLFMNKRLRAAHMALSIVAEMFGIVATSNLTSEGSGIAFGGVCVLIFLPITIIVTAKLTYDLRIERLTEMVAEKVIRQLRGSNHTN